MTPPKKTRRPHFCDTQPKDPAIRRFGQWPHVNQNFFAAYRRWLKETQCSPSTLNLYSVGARQAIGFLDKPYWMIDPVSDLDAVWSHLSTRPISPLTLSGYHKGLKKFAEFLCLKLHKDPARRSIHWDHYLGPLDPSLQIEIRSFLQHCQRAWKPDVQHERCLDKLSSLTASLRWMTQNKHLHSVPDLQPDLWYAYLDHRLAVGVSPITTNRELSALQHFVHFLQEQEKPVCERFLCIQRLDEGDKLPKDLPLELLRRLLAEIQTECFSSHIGYARLGHMDRAWFLLMLHCGLRSAEVRFLRLPDLDLSGRRLLLHQAKGLKDRVVFLSDAVTDALQAYLPLRGPADVLPEHVFIYRHRPLSKTYCFERLRTYGSRCGVRAHPHQLRHSCATLLLNAGAPVLSVQAL